MDERSYAAQIRRLRRCIDALRLLDLSELEACARTHGSAADRDLIAAVLLALETLPDEPHGS